MRWIKSPTWDLVWVLNALWLAPLVLLLARGHDDVRASPVDGLFFALTVPLWFGHRVSSAWLAYATPAYRPLLATQRLRFVVAPLAIAVACFAVLLAPESVLPMPLTERVVWLAVLDYLLVSYHFAAQHFGLLSLYRARAGRASDATTRRLDRWFALVVGGGFVVLAEALAGSIAFQDRWIDPLLGAVGSDLFARTLHDGGIVFVVILTALMLRVELRSQRPSLPRVAYVLGVSAMVLFAFLARDPFLFIVLWSVQHWSAAMGLASLAASGGSPGAWRALAAAAGAHQSARLGSAARARRRLHPAAAGAGGGGRDRRIRLRRPHLRRCGVVAALLALRAGAAGPGLRERLHPLPAGSRRLPLLLARREAGRPRPAVGFKRQRWPALESNQGPRPGTLTRARYRLWVAVMNRLQRSASPQVKLAALSGTWITPRQFAARSNTWMPPGPVQ